jgi:hypothetical protein
VGKISATDFSTFNSNRQDAKSPRLLKLSFWLGVLGALAVKMM